MAEAVRSGEAGEGVFGPHLPFTFPLPGRSYILAKNWTYRHEISPVSLVLALG
jgi:hypothetical protein